jgi:hypothetical protein
MLHFRAWVVGVIAAISFTLLAFNLTEMKPTMTPTILYTASHSEMAPFQRVWNPDTRSDYSLAEFSKDDSEAKDDDEIAVLCGEDGSKCPEVPAFKGEDYFDSKPIGFQRFGSYFNPLRHFFHTCV